MNLRLLLIVSLFALAGCEHPLDWVAVDEVEAWNGRSEKWLIHELGKPQSETRVATPVPEVSDKKGLQKRLSYVAPEYTGELRELTWRHHDWNTRAFLFKKGDEWFILDAFKWKDGAASF